MTSPPRTTTPVGAIGPKVPPLLGATRATSTTAAPRALKVTAVGSRALTVTAVGGAIKWPDALGD